ncbi:ribonucleoside-triphosphate reductase protein [Rhizobium phage RHph_I1_18]|nr:ribonucleoside-triphosphate reductase protein [Rhizobium phage RHph_I1_18]
MVITKSLSTANNNNKIGELMADVNARQMASDAKFFEGYSRWDDTKRRYETWNEAVDRVMNTHRKYYADKMTDELSALIDDATGLYKEKRVLGAQRALQFGGDQLLKHQMRLYNCVSSYADRPAFFNELFYILLCGAGAGFSVQKHHVAKLPEIAERKKQAKIFEVEDSIEGWADAVAVLMSSFFVGGGTHPEYEGRRVFHELTRIRDKNALISGGFKAPGPEPLRRALDKIEHLIQSAIFAGQKRLTPIQVYDIAMHIADAVLAGGVRRSATICLFSPDDEEMLTAKTGDWFEKNKQRARSNNSAVFVRSTCTWEQFSKAMKSVEQFGEPGFIFSDSTEHTYNPCVEIGKFPQLDGVSGWQGCNLVELNGAAATTKERFFEACRAGAILGTLQAGYTDFKYISEISKKIFDREALLGVSVTGWMNSPDVLFDAETLREGAEIVKAVNKKVAAIIGINPAARTTCVKPSGNASVLLMTASGIHGEHAPRYFRIVQMNKDQEVANTIRRANPYMVEDSVWSANNTDYAIFFPTIAPVGSIFKNSLHGVKLLERVKLVQNTWIEAGTDVDLCVEKTLRHNVSNTVTVPNGGWDEVAHYLFENRAHFCGVSFLSESGDKDFHQAPNTEVLTEAQIVERYGAGSIFAAGLVVDALKVFPNLWNAITIAKNPSSVNQEDLDKQGDWIRRFHKFADTYFDGDVKITDMCLKDVYLLHRWYKIQQNYQEIDFVSSLGEKSYTDINTMGAIACSGGACEI